MPRTAAPLISPDGEVAFAKEMADLLNQHFASFSRSEKKTAMSKARNKARKEQEREPDKLDDLGTYNAPFCRTELDRAIGKSKLRKAPGPYKLTSKRFHHLGGKARDKILEFVNKTWVDSRLPRAWEPAIIIPIAKKGKDAPNVESYRPISLTS